ncbi:MAG: DNA translocase FtsK, partial [Bacteroidetes bacterium]|nr:DNA translocase FtsK [Bacteroidota bacterium]
VVVVDYDIQATLDRGRRLIDWLRERISGRASALNEAYRTQRDEAAEQPTDEGMPPAGGSEVQDAGKKSRRSKTGETPPTVAPMPMAPPPPLQVSISRQKEEEASWMHPPVAGTERSVDAEGPTPRSNGTISRDSIEGLGTAFPVDPPAGTKESGTDSAATARDATKRGVAGGNTRAADETSSPLSDVVANEHERKAVQAAVARKVMESDSAADADALNKELAETPIRYQFPPADLLDRQVSTNSVSDAELRVKAAQVKEKLSVFGIGIESISVTPGPVVTLFELVPDSSVKISKITSLSDDLALALAARGIRIIAPIPGKSAVGIEIPNNAPELVSFRSVVTAPEFAKSKHRLTLGLGKSITGEVVCDDLARMPHLLIAGATGSGKSVGINVMITSLLYKMKPQQVKFVMIDPKKIELAQYRGLNRHFLATCPDVDEDIITDPANAVIVLKSLELEMDMRYTKLAKAGVRHVDDYNAKVEAGQLRDSEVIKHYQLPYIVVIIDELADLMITAAREVEEPIARLAQLARAVGIHLVVATQRPSVDVITGVIKANFPARIAYQVASRIDSRTVLDGTGADQLLGNGDMLFLPGGQPKPVRIQNAYLSTAEVERVVEFIADQRGYQRPYTLPSVRTQQKARSREDEIGTDDLLYEAARLIVRHQQGSVSLLQRRLKIGYSRAARIVDQLEMAGIVGPYDGSKARQVMVEDEDHLEDILQTL